MPSRGHPVANAERSALATAAGVGFEGGRIDALCAVGGEVLRTAAPTSLCSGIAQVRREVVSSRLRLLHVLFAPARARPLLLGVARLENRTDEPALVHYAETWAVGAPAARAGPGACEAVTPAGVRALADASAAIRAVTPDPLPRAGLALDVRVVLAPGARRHLDFVYAAPDPGQPAAPLVVAWRGDVAAELVRTVARWRARLGPGADPVAAYRAAVNGS